MKPFFSIVLITYNQLHFLRRSLKSIFAQDFKNWELIIVDNFSNDGSYEYLNKLSDKRIKIYRIKNNGMYVKSRNLGVKKSSSNWIAFIDTDDLWYSSKLSYCYNIIKKKNVDFIYHAVNHQSKNLFFIKKKIKEKSVCFKNSIHKNLFLNGNFIAQSSAVVKKKKIIEINYFSEDFSKYGWEDLDAWIKISKKSNNFEFIKKPLGEIYFGNENIGNLRLLKKILKNLYSAHGAYCAKNLKIDIRRTWWFVYNECLILWKSKKFIQIVKRLNQIPNSPFRFYIRMLFFKYVSIYKRILK